MKKSNREADRSVKEDCCPFSSTPPTHTEECPPSPNKIATNAAGTKTADSLWTDQDDNASDVLDCTELPHNVHNSGMKTQEDELTAQTRSSPT